MGLKVTIIRSTKAVDAEDVLAKNVREEAEHLPEVPVPAAMISDVDVTEDAVIDEFVVMDDGEVLDAPLADEEEILAEEKEAK